MKHQAFGDVDQPGGSVRLEEWLAKQGDGNVELAGLSVGLNGECVGLKFGPVEMDCELVKLKGGLVEMPGKCKVRLDSGAGWLSSYVPELDGGECE